MKHLLRTIIGIVISITIFAVAIAGLYDMTRGITLADVLATLEQTDTGHLVRAAVCTVIVYLIHSTYDLLALRYIGHNLSAGRAALSSFIGNTFSIVLGFALLTGGSVRFRLYTGWGLTLKHVAAVTTFGMATFVLLLLTSTGVVLVVDTHLFQFLGLASMATLRAFGVLFLIPAIGYLSISYFFPRSHVRFFRWRIGIPSFPIALGQLVLASLEASFSAGVLYALLPSAPGLTYMTFFGFYVLTQLLSLVSQIPGGVGVFDATMLALLRPFLPGNVVVSSLLLFRLLFYVLPLLVALLLLTVHQHHHLFVAVRSRYRSSQE